MTEFEGPTRREGVRRLRDGPTGDLSRCDRRGGRRVMLGVVASAAEIVRVSTLPRDGRLLVSFEMADGYTVEIREAVLSGLPTTFSYAVDLRRTTAFWFEPHGRFGGRVGHRSV